MLTAQQEIARDIVLAFIAKSGVREFDEAVPAEPGETTLRERVSIFAVEMAAFICANADPSDPSDPMAIDKTFRQQVGTVKTWKSSGGDAAMTPTSLANGSYYQGAKLDLGATFGQQYDVYLDLEFAATPTAGATVAVWLAGSTSGTAGTDNGGNVSGTDAAYTGYSSNAAASVNALQFVGAGIITAQATATVQKRVFVGRIQPGNRYVSPVILNGGGSAFHSTITNFQLRLEPVEYTSE